jgi:hypothetical protein
MEKRFVLFLMCLGVLALLCAGKAMAQEEESSELFPMRQKEKWGYIDRTGKVVIEPQFDFADRFSEELAAIRVGNETVGQYGYIDKTGQDKHTVEEPKKCGCTGLEALLFFITVKLFRRWKRKQAVINFVKARQIIQLIVSLITLYGISGSMGCASTPSCHPKREAGPEVLRSVEELSKTKPKIVAAVRGILDWICIDIDEGKGGYMEGAIDQSASCERVEWVWERLDNRNEIRFLIRKKDVSLPIIFERFHRDAETSYDSVLVYCVVFGRTKSIESLPYLADYIDSLPDSDRHNSISGYHPFNWAIYAVNMITNSEVSILPQKGEEDKNPWWFFDARHKYADAIRRWHKEHSHDSSPP